MHLSCAFHLLLALLLQLGKVFLQLFKSIAPQLVEPCSLIQDLAAAFLHSLLEVVDFLDHLVLHVS